MSSWQPYDAIGLTYQWGRVQRLEKLKRLFIATNWLAVGQIRIQVPVSPAPMEPSPHTNQETAPGSFKTMPGQV